MRIPVSDVLTLLDVNRRVVEFESDLKTWGKKLHLMRCAEM